MTESGTSVVHTDDAFDVLSELDDDSVHAVVTDPPYGLAFMGKSWDDFEPREYQEWCEEWARKAKRVLKPGGHLLAFSGNRTHHRLFTGVEDAGFEVRDTITWHYGSGFPKGANVGDGFKTQLKPATEYVVVARKPLSEGTVAENVETHGTGALNIDGTRVGYESEADLEETNAKNPGRDDKADPPNAMNPGMPQQTVNTEGRYPANVVFDETEADTVPSRYFYTSKASKSERTNGGSVPNDHPTVKPVDLMEWLVTLATARDQIVLDPFAGSGTTGLACKEKGRRFIGIELDPGYADIARARIGLTPNDPSRIRDAGELGLESFTDREQSHD